MTLRGISRVTDLSEFNRRGNKLLIYHGWADPLIPPQSSINYFNALANIEPGNGPAKDEVQRVDFRPGDGTKLAKTQDYARLFMVPGLYHCAGGPGPNVFDALTPLMQWVEQGVAPETILATNTPPAVQMTRPLCAYPKVAKYKGSGDSNVAANFVCVTDERDFNQTPTPSSGRNDGTSGFPATCAWPVSAGTGHVFPDYFNPVTMDMSRVSRVTRASPKPASSIQVMQSAPLKSKPPDVIRSMFRLASSA